MAFLLIQRGADANIRNERGETPLQVTYYRPNIEMVRKWLELRDRGELLI
jgi:ankyrin repeat protein